MNASYDTRTGTTLSIILRPDASVAESDADKRGIILDYHAGGNVVSLAILDARVADARQFEFETIG